MDSHTRIRKRTAAVAACRAGGEPGVAELVKPYATVVRARRRQQLPLSLERSEMVYVVRSGLLALHAALPGRRRLILGVLYPGDVFRAAFAPAMTGVELMAATASDVLRLGWGTVERLLRAETEIGRVLCNRLSPQQARFALRVVTIGSLTSEERVAAFLIELGLRLGTPTPGGIAFDVPLARADVAAYLALNPDTLSRHMSRLREKGVLEQWGRGRIVIRDWAALVRDCPVGEALQALHGKPEAIQPRGPDGGANAGAA